MKKSIAFIIPIIGICDVAFGLTCGNDQYAINGNCGFCNNGYCVQDGTCSPCPAGYYCPESNDNLRCDKMPCDMDLDYSAECWDNEYWEEHPDKEFNIPYCPKDTFSDTGASECTKCAPGYTTKNSGPLILYDSDNNISGRYDGLCIGRKNYNDQYYGVACTSYEACQKTVVASNSLCKKSSCYTPVPKEHFVDLNISYTGRVPCDRVDLDGKYFILARFPNEDNTEAAYREIKAESREKFNGVITCTTGVYDYVSAGDETKQIKPNFRLTDFIKIKAVNTSVIKEKTKSNIASGYVIIGE